MTRYELLVLVHILATGGLFAGLGVEGTALHRLQRASASDQARVWLPSLRRPAGMLPHISMLLLLVTGLWLAALRGSLDAWMTAALVAIGLMVLLTVALTAAPLTALTSSLVAEHSAEASGWRRRAQAPQLHWSLWLRVGLYAGILGLMALQPGANGSIALLVGGAALGAAAGSLARPAAADVATATR